MLLKLPETEGIALIEHDALNNGPVDPIIGLLARPFIRLPVFFAFLNSLQFTLDSLQRGCLAAISRVRPSHVALVTLGVLFVQAVNRQRLQS